MGCELCNGGFIDCQECNGLGWDEDANNDCWACDGDGFFDCPDCDANE